MRRPRFSGSSASIHLFRRGDIASSGHIFTNGDAFRAAIGFPSASCDVGALSARDGLLSTSIGRYQTVEASANKRYGNRWSGGLGYNFTWTREHGSVYGTKLGSTGVVPGYPNSGNDPGVHRFTTWGLRAFGSYDGPFGIRRSPVLRHQSGQPYGRTVSVANVPAGLFATGTVLVEPLNARRQDNVTVADIRVERSFSLGGRVRLRGFADAFNVSNSNAAETVGYQTGTSFERPTAILAPRTFRVGARLEW